MEREYTYVVDVFEVTLVEAAGDEVRPWDDEQCECPKFVECDRDPRTKQQIDIDCKHIRQAKLYHQLRGQVSPVTNADEDGQQPLDAFNRAER